MLIYSNRTVTNSNTILELFNRSKCNKHLQQAAAAKVVNKIEVINIHTTDSELECGSNPRIDNRGGLDDGGGVVCSYSYGQESGDCDVGIVSKGAKFLLCN